MAQIINPSLITYIYPNQVLDPTPINNNFYSLVNALNTYGVVSGVGTERERESQSRVFDLLRPFVHPGLE